MGTLAKEIWGDSDYEFWIDVPASALPKLVFALLREKYAGRDKAVDEFRAFCKQEEIEHEWDSGFNETATMDSLPPSWNVR